MKRAWKISAVVLATVAFCAIASACAPSTNPQRAVDTLKKHNYSAGVSDRRTIGELESICGCQHGDFANVVRGYGYKIFDGKKLEHITIIYCNSLSIAKLALENLKVYKSGDDPEWVIARSGRIVYYGTKNALNAAKGL